MELKKNDKVKVKLNEKEYNATIIGSPFRMFTEKEDYIEVYIKELGLEIPIHIKAIEKQGE